MIEGFAEISSILSSTLWFDVRDTPSDVVVMAVGNGDKTSQYQLLFTCATRGKLKLYTCIIGDVENCSDCAPWKEIQTPEVGLKPKTLAEKLLSERMRSNASGVTYFDYHADSKNLVFSYDGWFYSASLESGMPNMSTMKSLVMENALGTVRNPTNWRLLSFVKENNVFVIDIVNNLEKQLTFNGANTGSGSTHFIIQEEFNRFDGCWWRPVENEANFYHLLIEEFDESMVDEISIPQYTAGFDAEKYRYPKAGSVNAISNLKILKIRFDDHSNELLLNKVLILPMSLNELFPHCEYLTNVGWTPDGKYIWINLADRLQNSVYTYLLPFQEFSHEHIGTYKPFVVLFNEERNLEYWVPVNKNIYFLKNSEFNVSLSDKESVECYSCITGMTSTGYNHLYLINKYWTLPRHTDLSSFHEIHAETHNVIPLTTGEWEVDPNHIWVCEADKTVYFLGNRDDPLSNNLYKVSVNVKGQKISNPEDRIQRLTTLHTTAYLNCEEGFAVIVESSIYTPPRSYFMNITNPLNSPQVPITNPNRHIAYQLQGLDFIDQPRLLSYDVVDENDGVITLYGLLFVPVSSSSMETKWPTIHYVYGGPGVRLIENSYMHYFYKMAQRFNHFGYALLICDGRGSTGRGIKFQGHIKHKMGIVELEDQVFFLKKAAEATGLIDLERVAIHGSSYGGYLTILGVFNYPYVYKCGFSCSPVTNFELYDTAYTERYLGLPLKNPAFYKRADVLSYIHNLPKDKCRLIIAHGGQDENVHFQHTATLIQYANLMDYDIRLLFYPNSRHHINEQTHLQSHMIAFFNSHLK